MISYRNGFFIATIIVLLVSCFGCNKLNSVGQTDEPLSPWKMDFHKGTKGLSMKLIENQPPREVWESSAFQISVELNNEGTFDIQEGQLYVGSFNHISLNQEKRAASIGNLNGKDQLNPVGEFRILSFPALAESVDDDTIDTFSITACYKYATSAGLEVCINPNVLDIAKVKDGECKPSSVSGGGGQGAPVVVSKVDEEVIPMVIPRDGGDKIVTKVLFNIHISNNGGGKVVKDSAFLKPCSSGQVNALDPEKESNVVKVRSVKFSKYSFPVASGDYAIDCSGFMNNSKSYLKISEKGDAVLSCSAILKEYNVYTSPLIVELEYGYTEFITKSINVKNIPGS